MKIIQLNSVLKTRNNSLKMTEIKQSKNNNNMPTVRRFSSHSTVKKYTNFNSLKLEHMDFLSKLQNKVKYNNEYIKRLSELLKKKQINYIKKRNELASSYGKKSIKRSRLSQFKDEEHFIQSIRSFSIRDDGDYFKPNISSSDSEKYVNFKMKDSISSMNSSLSILNEEQKKAVASKIKRKYIFYTGVENIGKVKNESKIMICNIHNNKSYERKFNNTASARPGVIAKSSTHLCKCHKKLKETKNNPMDQIKNKIIVKKLIQPRKFVI